MSNRPPSSDALHGGLKTLHGIRYTTVCKVNKVETWYTLGQWVNVSSLPESDCCCLFVPLFLHFPSPQFSNIKTTVTLFSGNCKVYKVETWYTLGQWVNVSSLPESDCCCLFVPFFLHFLSPQFSNIKMFRHIFLMSVRQIEIWNLILKRRNTKIGLLIFSHRVISSFFCLSNFQLLTGLYLR